MNAQAQKFVNAILNLKSRTKARKTEIYAYWSTGQGDRTSRNEFHAFFRNLNRLKLVNTLRKD